MIRNECHFLTVLIHYPLIRKVAMGKEQQENDTKKYCAKAVTLLAKLAASLIAKNIASGALLAVKSVSSTNIHKFSVSGDSKMSPTNEETNLQESRQGASKTDAALSQDEVAAQKGKVDAAETNAKAATTEATAAEAGAQAMKTKAGACDIQTKGMKLN